MASFISNFPTPLDRQFAKFYNYDKHQYAHLHKNNSVCLIGLSTTHPAVLEGVTSVTFGKAAMTNEALGKKKRGALGLRVETLLCTITTKADKVYTINACVNVDFVEINTRIIDEPELVSEDPEMSGFLCAGLTRAENNMDKCFPGFTKTCNMMKFISKFEE